MKIPLSKLPPPRELAHGLYQSGEEFVALLESGQGFAERARFTLVAWGVERAYVSSGPDLQQVLYLAQRELKADGGPFGGDVLIGALTYEASYYMEPLLLRYNKVDRSIPAAFLVKPRGYILYDKMLGRGYLRGEMPKVSVERRETKVRGPVAMTDPNRFKSWVAEGRERIAAGEILQVVLSRWVDYRAEGDLFPLYKALAEENPSPYMYFVKYGDIHLIGTSPELLVKVQSGRVETHPIAGTRPRGATEEEDLALEEDMLSDEKELAEHIMLVDLARNDIGRVCQLGSVKVEELFAVEKYSRVQHIVSRVMGVMDRRFTPVDALLATHPAGTVSGAPKVRAMEIIAELEDEPRRFYAGAVGFISPSLLEFAIVIRTIVAMGDSLRIQAGAGVVYDSTPEREFRETESKLAALRAVVEGGPWT
ncbi:anthranilate synthase, component I [Pyrobaculum islandicum DSM 4184]|uniref:anthranilate synthase n=1 Tax=Pyrobaculum islandicum (strain DSM 4184 / JCM 9189 / GEO3) TaxID=384616 RepID=A1RVS9_PYRIL|nr:chorismate-binding protein [Pyrobaculum islandicum]ABL89061.1 anthranilate synthase, component I [Pyrobaculum islandicum DSM 4184]